MIQIFAEEYIALGRIFQWWESVENPSTEALSEDHFNTYRTHLEGLEQHCNKLDMSTSQTMAGRAMENLPTTTSYKEACAKITQLREVVEVEMEARAFMYVPVHRARYMVLFKKDENGNVIDRSYGEELRPFEPMFTSFQSCRYDVEEAGNCFAAGRFTACVHHLSRVVEFGMVSLATYAGVEEKERKNWNTALNRSHERLREKQGNFAGITPHSPEEIYFSEAIGLLRNFNTAWRNPSSHAPEIFLEDTAKVLFPIARATMTHLSKKLAEVPMPTH